MRILAILLNIALIIFMSYMMINEKNMDSEEWIIFTFLMSVAIVNIIVIFSKGESWLGLYFKRKRLEEQQKIEDLSNKN